MASMVGSQPRQRAFLASHSAPAYRLPPAILRWGNKKRKKQREVGRGKKTENFTHKSEKWTLGGIYARTRAHSTLVQGIVCQSSEWPADGWVIGVGFGGGIVKDGGDSLPTRPSHSVSGLRPPSGIRRFSNAKTKLKPNRTKTEALRYDAMRNATKTNMFFN